MSDNRTSNGLENDKAPPRLSIKIPRNFKNANSSTVSFRETELMSPRTTTVSHPSSSMEVSKEVPRAALLLSNNSSPATSDFAGVSDLIEMSSAESLKDDQNLRNLVEDSILGLKALAASAVASFPESPSDRVSSPPESPQVDEIELLGKLFNRIVGDDEISRIYSEHCAEAFAVEGKKKLSDIIEKADSLLSSNGIAMSLKSILPFYIKNLVEQEALRTGRKDLTGLLMNESFLSASATVILLVPHLVSCIVSVEQVADALNADLFDVLLAIENLLKVLPDLMKLAEIQTRMKQLQQVLLESLVWKVKNGESTLYTLLKSEFKQIGAFNCPTSIASTLSGIRSSQKALETLSGFPSVGSRATRLEIFFRKYLRLAAQRLQFATLRLGLGSSATQLAWELFFELVQYEGYDGKEMLKNRHLNQILLATIYCSSRLLEQERSFQQICQVLPSAQSNSTWLSKVSIGDEGASCDFYTFYNEIFVPPIKKRIETFLNRFKEECKDEKWILNELFTTAPFPKSPSYNIASNVTLNRLNQLKNNKNSQQSTTKFEWMCPYSPALIPTVTDAPVYPQQMPQTPSNTSQLLNIPTSFYNSATEQHDLKRRPPPTDETDQSKEFRLKKVARRLDFNEEA